MTSTPLLTALIAGRLQKARIASVGQLECSLDLGRSSTQVEVGAQAWTWQGCSYPYPVSCKDRTIYFWNHDRFDPVARYSTSLVKLVPTEWGAPTFEIDGIKMLPTSKVSPYADAQRKVGLVQPRNRVVLDTCGGLGYFAAACLESGAQHIDSFERNADVLWLRSLNPWSPPPDPRLSLTRSDVTSAIAGFGERTFDAVLHDPPRFGIAGELYSAAFYRAIARVLKPRGRLFHYTGTPNRKATGRELAVEVARRLKTEGFAVEPNGDGLLAIRR